VNGVVPSHSNIFANSYPIGRTLYHVTKKADADCPKTGGACDFTGNPGPTLPSGTGNDLNVAGGTSGRSGAVREFTRFICRPAAADQAIDPFNGKNYQSEVSGAIGASGFSTVPTALRNGGTICRVQS
jgi:hypothetical protein